MSDKIRLGDEPTEEQILEAAKINHGITGTDEASLLTLIRYVRHIGYNEGWKDHKKSVKGTYLD